MPKAILTLRSIDISERKLSFVYIVSGHEITRAITFPDTVNLSSFVSDKIFGTLVKYCALGDCIYMYNFDYFDQIDVPFDLSDEEKAFFEETYDKGLAEFRYTNGIEMTRMVKLHTSMRKQADRPSLPIEPATRKRAFVLNGGGKDGVVAMELAKHLGLDVAWFSSGANVSRQGVVKASGVTDSFVVERCPDPNATLERKYEGHKPMSLYVAMVSSLCAYLNNRYYVIAANEYSASFPNLHIDGMAINHQYTKSLEFECGLRKLFKEAGVPVRYFSIVRPLYELQIVKLFSEFDQYHDAFVSCNRGIRDNKWCLDCAKCAFVVGAMYCFTPEKAAKKWGAINDVYQNNPGLLDETIELINPDQKPFECIGTTQENLYLITMLFPLLTLSVEQKVRYESYKKAVQLTEAKKVLSLQTGVDLFPAELKKTIYRTIGEAL